MTMPFDPGMMAEMPMTEEMPEEELDSTPAQASEGPIDLSEGDYPVFAQMLDSEIKRAKADRQPLVTAANAHEVAFNLEDYQNDQLPFSESLSIRLPASVARCEKTASALSSTFDKDGAPTIKHRPVTPSAVPLAAFVDKFVHHHLVEAAYNYHARRAINRATKIGIGFTTSEVVSSNVMSDGSVEMELLISSPKLQDVYLSPINVQSIEDAAFVGHRFQMPRWKFEDWVADGYFAEPMDPEGQPYFLNTGYADDDHGQTQEFRRIGTAPDNVGDGELASDFYDLIKGYVRFRPEGETQHKLFFVVFSAADPRIILRCKENPYMLLDHAPYSYWNVDEGDGTIWGRGQMALLSDLQQLLDTYHMLRIEGAKRGFSKVWLVRTSSRLAQIIRARRAENGGGELEGGEDARSAGVVRLMPDEILETDNPENDLYGLPLVDNNQQFQIDEQNIQRMMDEATTNVIPMQGIRSAMEVRLASQQEGGKLRGMLKVVATTGLIPSVKIIRAQLWEWMMPALDASDYVHVMEYGDVRRPISRPDWFEGFSIEPNGSSTYADSIVRMTTTASLVSEILPILAQFPGVVPDVPRAVRTIINERLKALEMDEIESIMGTAEPTPEEMQRSQEYILWLKQVLGQVAVPNALGGDGGQVMGAQSSPNTSQGGPQATGEMSGQSATANA